jgi:hypothetical protein
MLVGKLIRQMEPLRYFPYVLAGAVAISVGVVWSKRRRKTPEQHEQERRVRINQEGRITDGTVLDTNESNAAQLVIYTYDVGGVTYEASQDVTNLRHFVDLHACRIGLPASIKYDPQNPGNSIVVAEGWTGLRRK